MGLAGLDSTRVRLGASSSAEVTVYDTGGSRIGFNAAHQNGGLDSFAGPGYVGENVRATFYLGLASAPRADVTAVAKIIVGTQMERYDSDNDGDTDTDDGIVERTEYTHIIQHEYPGGEFTVARVRIADDDTSHVHVVGGGISFDKKFYTDVEIVLCTVGGRSRAARCGHADRPGDRIRRAGRAG